MSSPWFWILLSLSLIGTSLCWARVIKSDDFAFFKVVGFIISAIPFLGPFLFLFLDMPPRMPEEAQAKREWRGTTLYTDITRKLFQGNRRYAGSKFGAQEFDGKNREWRCATGDKDNSN
jgi:hypothetical protein